MVVVVKMIFNEDILVLLNVALYPFFCLPEEGILANCFIARKIRAAPHARSSKFRLLVKIF